MVYCSKCGAKNEEGAKTCVKCGESLYPLPLGEEIERRVETCFGPRERPKERQMEEECFGIPRGGTIVGLVIGLIIILVGFNWMLSHYYRIRIEILPMILIILGMLIIIGALYGLSRR